MKVWTLECAEGPFANMFAVVVADSMEAAIRVWMERERESGCSEAQLKEAASKMLICSVDLSKPSFIFSSYGD